MADDKKKDFKKDAKPDDGGDAMGVVGVMATVVAVVVVAAYVLSGRNLSSGEPVPSLGEILSGENAPEGSPLNPEAEQIAEGAAVINREEVTVRVDLERAAIAGQQPERAKGKVKDGPAEAYGRTWYFVDYAKAPDGWVEAKSITAAVGTYTAINIVPIAFAFMRPFAIALAIIVGLALLWLWWKGVEAEHMGARKLAEEHRAYLARTGRAAPVAAAPAAAGAPIDLPGADLELPEGWGAPTVKPPKENERWNHIRTLVASASSSDWRQAIIEADIMLEEMLRAIGYDGGTIGDMLKNVDPADFVTLEKAWEAHKVRNQIAHRGIDFRVDRTEAERTIKLFEDVFREFNYL